MIKQENYQTFGRNTIGYLPNAPHMMHIKWGDNYELIVPFDKIIVRLYGSNLDIESIGKNDAVVVLSFPNEQGLPKQCFDYILSLM